MIDTSLHQSEPVTLPDRSFGKQARSVAGYALLTAMMIITQLLVFVPAVLFHCGIRNGRRAAWATAGAALAIASLFVAAAIPAAAPDVMRMAWANFAAVALAIVLPSVAALPLIERHTSFGRLMVFLMACGAAGHVAIETVARTLLAFSPFRFHVAQMVQVNEELLKLYRNGAAPDAVRMAERWAAYNTTLLPALTVIGLALVFLLSILMFGRLNAWREHLARRDGDALGTYLFRNFALPEWVLFAFLVGGITPLATGLLHQIAANTLVVVTFLYILQGLAIFRSLLVAMGVGAIGTILGGLLLLITGLGLLPLAVAGLFDPFFDFRHFKKRKDDSHESHSD